MNTTLLSEAVQSTSMPTVSQQMVAAVSSAGIVVGPPPPPITVKLEASAAGAVELADPHFGMSRHGTSTPPGGTRLEHLEAEEEEARVVDEATATVAARSARAVIIARCQLTARPRVKKVESIHRWYHSLSDSTWGFPFVM